MADASPPLRVGLIGASLGRSWAAVAHAPAITSSSGLELVAVATTNAQSAEEAAQRFGARHAFADTHSLIDHPDVDLVTVSVRVPSHAALASRAIEAGKAVYCEWPLASTTDEAEALYRLARARGTLAVVGLQGRASATVAHARELLDAGFVGRPLAVSVLSSQQWGGPVIIDTLAYMLADDSGANAVSISLGHTLDTVCTVLRESAGALESVTATMTTQYQDVILEDSRQVLRTSVPDCIAASGTFSSGALLNIVVRSGEFIAPATSVELSGTDGVLRLHAEGGALHVSPLKLHGRRKNDTDFRSIPGTGRDSSDGSLPLPAVNVARLYERIGADRRDGTRTAPTFEDAVHLHRALDTIREAARANRPIHPASNAL